MSLNIRECPLCGQPVFALAYHHCRGIGAQPAQQPDELSQIQSRRIHAMITDHILTHQETCAGCKSLGRSCFEIMAVEDLQKKWKQKAGLP